MTNLPLILIPGAGCNHRMWPEKLRSSSQLNVVTVDLPGHGGKVSQGRTTIEEYVEYVKSFLEDQAISKAIFCGHSMGGAISMTLALKYPERVAGLILVGTGARLKVAPFLMRILKTKFLFWVALRIFLFTSLARDGSSRVRETVKEMLKNSGRAVLYGDLTACNHFDKMNEIGRITAPALIVCGREDQLAPLKYSQYLNKKIKGSTLEIIDGVGHFPSLENSDEFLSKVITWLQKNHLLIKNAI